MKNFNFITGILLGIGLLTLISCKNDLNLLPLDEFTEASISKDPVLAEALINNIYANLDDYIANSPMTASFVDEAHDRKGYFNINNCLITPDVIPDYGGAYGGHLLLWDGFYKNIRSCNLILEKINQIEFSKALVDGKTMKDRMAGEVHFLRAYLYFGLTKLYGGVPLISKAYGLTDKFSAARDTYANSIKFIVSECDSASNLLPIIQSGDNDGRATKGAALSLKSRVLLFAASDLYNTPVSPGFSNPELIGYTDGNRSVRWQAAKDAAKEVIDMGIYSLYKAEPGANDVVSQNIVDYFLSKSRTAEDIFLRYYVAKGTENNSILNNGPNGFHCFGHNTPSGNFVDAFEMADGTTFSWNNSTQAANPYKNREPRFYATVLYEGVHWRERPADAISNDPLGNIQVGVWQKWDNTANKMVELWGLDTRNSPFQNWNASWTGYYLRKLIDPAVDGVYYGSEIPCRMFRYGEILLNYAEACIELGQDAEAKQYINMIRKRAGMPDVTQSGADLRIRYRHERKIELAFEGHRFYDVRRWVIGSSAYVPVNGVLVTYKLNPDHTTATVPTITPQWVQNRTWDNKAYFFPIKRDEMNKNDLLIQNPGY